MNRKIIQITSNILKTFQQNEDEFNRLGITSLQPFPKGWCEEAALITQYILTKENFSGFKIIKGKKKYSKDNCHFWLESNEYAIDLTAHQFPQYKVNNPILLIEKEAYHLRKIFIPDIEYKSIYWKHFEITFKPFFLEKYNNYSTNS